MTYVTRVQRAVDFIEGNLREDIQLRQIASTAAFSPFHFHRIFKLTVGETLKSYIRRRRLTEAARELRASDHGVLRLALDYQFESQASFTRAFKKMFELTPGNYRRANTIPRFREKQALTKETIMHRAHGIEIDSTIATKESFWIVGLEYVGSKQHGAAIGALWQRFDMRSKEVSNRVDGTTSFGACFSTPSMMQNDEFSYVAGVPVSEAADVPEGMVAREVKGGDYVLVTHTGAITNVESTFDFIYGAWLPKSGYDPADRPSLELYDERFKFNADDSAFDILVPIRKPG